MRWRHVAKPILPQLHQHARDHLIEQLAPKEAEAMQGIMEQQKLAANLRTMLTQSTADLIDFARADELTAAASAELT